MKKKAGIISIFFIMSFQVSAFVGCGSILYESRELEKATVGVYYTQSIDTAEGGEDENVTYKLKEGSTLPEGLSLEGGSITGTPEKAVEAHSFTVVAATESADAEATYTITVERGKLTYADAEANVIIDKENSGSVAFATGSTNISYELVGGTMPKGLTLATDGTITGLFHRILWGREVTVKATAPDCDPAEAKIVINVIYPYLEFTGRTLADAKQGVFYAASVAYAEEVGTPVTYSLKNAESLPVGLSLDANGIITGVSDVVKRGTPFTVVAKADGFTDTEADFLIDVVLNRESAAAGEIVNFKGAELPVGYQDSYYLNQVGVSAGAVSLNNNNITYELVNGETLPSGLELYPNGAIFGMPTGIETCSFEVTAKSKGCADVTAAFTLRIKGSKVKYQPSMTAPTATRGEAYSLSVASATAGEGVPVKYATDNDALAAIGLSMDENGLITGVPTKSVKQTNFKVTASAGEDYTDAECTVYLHIQEPLTEATVFEAEYIDLTGIKGVGYSGAPAEEGLIYNGESGGASNGYFLNFLHSDKIVLTFNIYADTEASATLSLSLGFELPGGVLTPNEFDVSVNGTSVNYGAFSFPGGNNYASFKEYNAGTVDLKAGLNVIKLAVKSNTLLDGKSTGGPGVDCIKLNTSTTLKWRPCVYNFANVKG